MSKQSDAKEAQGWQKKADMCADCRHFTSDIESIPDSWRPNKFWTEEKNLRCSLGDFKTGKSNICKRFERKADVAA